MKYLRIFVSTLILCFAFTPTMIKALDNYGSLRIEYHDEEQFLVETQFDIYRIADVDSSGAYYLVEEFGTLDIEFSNMTNEKWENNCLITDSYIDANKIKEDNSGKTDANGVLVFSNLQNGLYFVRGMKTTIGNTTYYPQTFMVVVKDKTEVVQPKFSKIYESNQQVDPPMVDNNPPTGDDYFIFLRFCFSIISFVGIIIVGDFLRKKSL